MDVPNTTRAEIPPITANASIADKEQFLALWQIHLDLLEQGHIVYFIPVDLARKMGNAVLNNIVVALR